MEGGKGSGFGVQDGKPPKGGRWFFLKSDLCILTSFVGPDLAFAGGGGVVAWMVGVGWCAGFQVELSFL